MADGAAGPVFCVPCLSRDGAGDFSFLSHSFRLAKGSAKGSAAPQVDCHPCRNCRHDYVPQDGDQETVYFNASGRIHFLRNPKLAAIILTVPGVFFPGAGIYTLGSGVEIERDGQGIAFVVGAVLWLSLAVHAWATHVKWSRAKARAETTTASGAIPKVGTGFGVELRIKTIGQRRSADSG